MWVDPACIIEQRGLISPSVPSFSCMHSPPSQLSFFSWIIEAMLKQYKKERPWGAVAANGEVALSFFSLEGEF